jgi:hypothetical protein
MKVVIEQSDKSIDQGTRERKAHSWLDVED